MKERREETYHYVPQSTRYTVNSAFNNNDKRRISSTSQHDPLRSSPRNSLSNIKPTVTSMTKEKSPVPTPLEPVFPAVPIPAEKVPSPPRLSSHSSSSSLASLLKRQTKLPPVVFLNKSVHVELNDVSFGFDIDPITEKISSDPVASPADKEPLVTNPSTPPLTEAVQLDEVVLTDFVAANVHERTFQQRHTRDPRFYSGSDIRPPHRAYASVPMSSAPFMDPLLLQYNQQRFPNYSQPLSYMNLLRTPYLPSQAQYLLVPTSYPSAAPNEMDSDEKSLDDQISQPAQQVQEPLLVYTNIPNQSGPMYFHPSAANKSFYVDPKQGSPAAVSNMYSSAMAMYPPPMFYPRPAQHLYPSSAAYFQPISSPSLFVDTKLDERQNIDPAETSGKYGQTTDTLPSASSDIMSSALQLVYSQQRRNAQTDRFNLDDLTAYLAMKWTETVDHYEQGRISSLKRHSSSIFNPFRWSSSTVDWSTRLRSMQQKLLRTISLEFAEQTSPDPRFLLLPGLRVTNLLMNVPNSTNLVDTVY